MTIHIAAHIDHPRTVHHPFVSGYLVQSSAAIVLAYADTEAEAEQAKRAFELVLAPRFTRDEAIAIVRANLPPPADARSWSADYLDGFGRGVALGMRAALEALAAADVFSDCTHAGSPASSLCALDMVDLLDAAGIR